MERLLVKVSGSCINEKVLNEVSEEAKSYCVVLVHGAGEQFNEASEEEIVFKDGNRQTSQEQLKKFYFGPQQEIRDLLHSVFDDKALIISPIIIKDGIFENTNSDNIFIDLYKMGYFKKGIVYAQKGHDKSHLQLPGVEIRYIG